jgi:nicotinate dehydrogenase subunit A
MSARSLLERIPNPTVAQIQEALTGHLCRCGTHTRIVKAIQRAAKELQA